MSEKPTMRPGITPKWYCPTCKEYLIPERVTYEETCDTCGTDAGGSAAPDMIETLIESYHTIKAEVDQWGERKEHHPMQPTLTQIEATLRKAGVTED